MPEETKKIAGVERNIFWMGLVSFLTDVSSEMIFTVLPLFMSNFLGLSKSVIGLIEGIAESTSSFLKLLSGWLSDKFDTRKPLVVAGYSFSTVVKPLLVLADS
ncbi:MAG: MFS transporter, partial [Candidatus Altiarchaeota archaeon]|nr:MFS transporter [Candidatus Altiarchaeota archaeon]